MACPSVRSLRIERKVTSTIVVSGGRLTMTPPLSGTWLLGRRLNLRTVLRCSKRALRCRLEHRKNDGSPNHRWPDSLSPDTPVRVYRNPRPPTILNYASRCRQV